MYRELYNPGLSIFFSIYKTSDFGNLSFVQIEFIPEQVWTLNSLLNNLKRGADAEGQNFEEASAKKEVTGRFGSLRCSDGENRSIL